jgi:hypothetical protein
MILNQFKASDWVVFSCHRRTPLRTTTDALGLYRLVEAAAYGRCFRWVLFCGKEIRGSVLMTAARFDSWSVWQRLKNVVAIRMHTALMGQSARRLPDTGRAL